MPSHANTWYNTSLAHLNGAAFFSYLLGHTAELNSTDPRNKVFAVVGLAEFLSRRFGKPCPEVRIDYNISITELYIRTMTYLLNSLNILTLLSGVQYSPVRSVKGLPSWVQDFKDPPSTNAILDLQAGHTKEARVFHASKETQIGVSIDSTVLTVNHFAYDTVVATSDTWAGISSKKCFESIFALGAAQQEISGRSNVAIDKIWQTMLCDLTGFHHREFPQEDLRCGFRDTIKWFNRSMIRSGRLHIATTSSEVRWQTALSSKDPTNTIPEPEGPRLLAQNWEGEMRTLRKVSLPFQHIVGVTMLHRRLILLENGGVGVGAEETKPGDKVCIVADGVKVPLVLRKAQSGENDWLLIGEAYVKDIMQGEAVDQMQEMGKMWERIRLV